MLKLFPRPYSETAAQALRQSGLPPLLARLYAARGVQAPDNLKHKLMELLPYADMKNCVAAASRLADAIRDGEKLLVVADYDADGATACAVAVTGLTALGAKVGYIVPNRFEYGYGLSPEIAQLASGHKPDLLITVDNGIAAHAGIEEAKRLGLEVLVTDHHLPGDTLPDALIVNPNQPGCDFPSKNLAGVGVMFYVLMALRAEMRKRGAFDHRPQPNLAELLDLVALGTVADVVKLDANNRLLVAQGLMRMQKGLARPGIQALFATAGRKVERAGAEDLGFVIGPRLNAAGRLADMSVGIECLLARDEATAKQLAGELDRLNRERREIEADMQDQALALLDGIQVSEGASLTLFDPAWHQGVVGLLASRLKERHHRPTIVFADGGDGLLKGSGRSIPGLHLRDALDVVDRHHPGLILKFGGHAAAAGLTLRREGLDTFTAAFEAVARESLSAADLEKLIETDGELTPQECTLENAEAIRGAVWGQGFPAPAFHGEFSVQSQRLVGEKHLKLRLSGKGVSADAILFFHDTPLPERIQAVYRPEVNEWNGNKALQFNLAHWSEL
ncbi:MAG: single-stranded-DNA-specific exonuclease RecJ [Hydrogenophilales bacterium CG17_big_fil_post_rev_8_21_14_2_50_63_12]|nr:MAG: single-stranded-DNA-specific exonuclease RecJ [Hydrogenophilales bacterium CG17_big_fil_post_rev_8_21_14_2_50_63_12]PIX97652.1 MAG: single-stranded-DNA-specific exonuclease RecJ [Hydrogenophilales bacterium CG_4_10_14_3_um_filter_63_21]PJB04537.1 MAG: single-stranded-DNA-specific exonuclease RecJ [Hydrogenophilales bacterium CG_4_9_14_3_um_filter_63_34]